MSLKEHKIKLSLIILTPLLLLSCNESPKQDKEYDINSSANEFHPNDDLTTDKDTLWDSEIENFMSQVSKDFQDKNIDGLQSLVYQVDDPPLIERQSIDRIYMPRDFHTEVQKATFHKGVNERYSFPNLPEHAKVLGTIQLLVSASNEMVYFPWYHIAWIDGKIYFVEPVRTWSY